MGECFREFFHQTFFVPREACAVRREELRRELEENLNGRSCASKVETRPEAGSRMIRESIAIASTAAAAAAAAELAALSATAAA